MDRVRILDSDRDAGASTDAMTIVVVDDSISKGG